MQPLHIVFHQDESEWQVLYRRLYDSPAAHHLEIPIHHLNSARSFPAFYYGTDEIMGLLNDILESMLSLTRLMEKVPPLAISHFIRSSMVEEIKSTNDIEGVKSTRKEIRTAMAAQKDSSAVHSVRFWSIVNKYSRLERSENIPFQNSCDLRAFYDDFVLDEVLRDDKDNRPDGLIFRKNAVEVRSPAKVIHRGLYPESLIIETMDKVLSILNDPHTAPLVRIALFHYFFGYIHPFYDGNGRTSRFITSYYLSKILNPLAAMRFSMTVKKSLKLYYKMFEITNSPGNAGDLTLFITGFLKIILESIDSVTSELEKRSRKLTELAGRPPLSTIPNPKDRMICLILLQAALFSEEGMPLSEIRDAVHLGERTIRSRIDHLPEGLVIVNKDHHAYRYSLNLKMPD